MNILILCTYPIKNPRHGGQLRVRNIVDTYCEAGNCVEVVGVLGSEQYDNEAGFLPCPSVTDMSRHISNPWLMEDYALGQLYAKENLLYRRLSALVQKIPNVIHVEQPWLFAFAVRYREEFAPKAKLLYGSQNIEYRLKREILRTYLGDEVAEKSATLIRQLEMEAVSGADAVICVSEEDVKWTNCYTDKPVVLAPNGVKPWQSNEEGRKEAATHAQGNAYALYCASAHPPNMTGFFNMFSGGFGSLKPDEKLIIAGGAGWSIAGDARVHQSPKLAEKVVVAGVVSQPCLEGLLDGAHCIVLPLTQGGGTNLKTAEALWAGKYVVATTVAMRGFERFIGSPGVFLADDSSAFKRALRLAMSSQPLEISPTDIEFRSTVLWASCLKLLPDFLYSIVTESGV